MELLQTFVIWSILVCHAWCAEDYGVLSKDGVSRTEGAHRGSPFENSKIVPLGGNRFDRYTTNSPRFRDSSDPNTSGLILKIVLITILLLFLILKFLCYINCKRRGSREELSNTLAFPGHPSTNTYHQSFTNAEGFVNPSFAFAPQVAIPSNPNSGNLLSGLSDLPPKYSDVVAGDFTKQADLTKGDKSPYFTQISESPPPDYETIHVEDP